jgi:hypothetical protein
MYELCYMHHIDQVCRVLNPVHQPAQALTKPAWPQAARLKSLQSFKTSSTLRCVVLRCVASGSQALSPDPVGPCAIVVCYPLPA